MPGIMITPSFSGFLTPKDLLISEGTFRFQAPRHDIQQNGFVFQVLDDDFVFALSFQHSDLVCQRNETVSVLKTNQLPSSIDQLMFHVTWTFDHLTLSCGMGSHHTEATVPTIPTAPPPSLIKWARAQDLLPVVLYDSEEEFRAKVHSCLSSIQDKVSETGAVNPFWNITYEGNTIRARLPKKEMDIHPTIYCLLSDQMLMSSVQVVPEYKTGVGNLDFLFVASVRGKGLARLCAEFKNAHSPDIYNGLETQLPLYMRNSNAEYGAYCVLGFQGNWFDKPDKSLKDLHYELELRKMQSSNPVLSQVRIFMFDFSKTESASKQ